MRGYGFDRASFACGVFDAFKLLSRCMRSVKSALVWPGLFEFIMLERPLQALSRYRIPLPCRSFTAYACTFGTGIRGYSPVLLRVPLSLRDGCPGLFVCACLIRFA